MTVPAARRRRPTRFPTRPPWIVSAALAISAASASCVFRSAGDVVARFGVRNQSDQAMIVGFAGTEYHVPAGASGVGLELIGGIAGPIRILDEHCEVLQELELSTQVGWVTIDADGVARLERSVDLSGPSLEVTDACDS